MRWVQWLPIVLAVAGVSAALTLAVDPSGWISLGSVQGPAGPPGPAGPEGPAGPIDLPVGGLAGAPLVKASR